MKEIKKKFDQMADPMSVKEVSALLRVDSSTIYKWVESKKLSPVIQLGDEGSKSLIRIPKSSLAHKIFKDGFE